MPRFVVSAGVVYLLLFPVWRVAVPGWTRVVVGTYAATSGLWEHPRRSLDADVANGEVRLHMAEGFFAVAMKNAFIDLPLLIALVVATPGIGWVARARIGGVGMAVLFAVHYLGFAAVVRLGYADLDAALGATHPASAVWFWRSIKELIYSDWILILPFVLWGAGLALERRRAPSSVAYQSVGR